MFKQMDMTLTRLVFLIKNIQLYKVYHASICLLHTVSQSYYNLLGYEYLNTLVQLVGVLFDLFYFINTFTLL